MKAPTPKLRAALASAIKAVRKRRQLTQEEFGLVSSRTYLSTLERGLKSPTVDKLVEISEVMTVHPGSLVLLACALAAGEDCEAAIDAIAAEAKALLPERLP